MDEMQFMKYMKRMEQERERIGANICRKVVIELPETGDTDTIYYILQDESAVCSDSSYYNVYKMWHLYPEGDWCDWGNIEVPKHDEDYYLGCGHAEEFLDDAINDIL